MNTGKSGLFAIGAFLLVIGVFVPRPLYADDVDLRVKVRGGCLDETNCCFGKWKIKSDADVYETDDEIDRNGVLKAGVIVEAVEGRVQTEPGLLKVVYNHGEWRKGQTIGLYSEPDDHGKAQIGTLDDSELENASFLKSGKKCDKPSKGCWALEISHPKVKWVIKVKLPKDPKATGDDAQDSDDRTGWVDSSHVATDTVCRL